MRPDARYAAAIDILDDVIDGAAAEKTLTNWARGHRFAGSKDRAAIRDIVYDTLRGLASCCHIGGARSGRGAIIGLLREQAVDPATVFTGEGYAPTPLGESEMTPTTAMSSADAANVQDWVHPILQDALGNDLDAEIALMRDRAPLDLRVNLALSDRARAQSLLAIDTIETTICDIAKSALRVVPARANIVNSKAYLNGFVEIQDAASQAVVEALPLSTSTSVLDYCAGGGGKSLAIAALAPNAQVDAWDANNARLEDLPNRAKRATARINILKSPPQGRQYDLVLVDAPCSGSGTWRRDPDAKWKLTKERLAHLETTQAQILEEAAQCVADGGALAYATCSLFPPENSMQIQTFLTDHSNWDLEISQQYKLSDGADGFFYAVLRKVDK